MSPDPRSPLSRELADPWGWLIAAVVGGVGWAALDSVAGGLLIGAAVLIVKVVLGALRGSKPEEFVDEVVGADTLPLAHPTSAAGRLLTRAESAVTRMGQLSVTSGDPWLKDEVSSVERDSREALESLRVLAGRVTLVEQSIAGADPARLASEAVRLQRQADATSDPRLASALQTSIQAIGEQQQVATRLASLRDTLLARMESAALGLEGLAARMGEVVALGPTALEDDRVNQLVSGLTGDLESLRGGLDEAQRLTGRGLPPALG